MTLTTTQTVKILLALSVVALIAFSIPFFTFHQGLPTGDSQKSIIWAQRLLDTGRLPNYQESIALLNRDPVDFYTPALHVLTAALLTIGGLPAIGIFAILVSIGTALVGAALAWHVLPEKTRALAAITTFILILTHERFLRYLREPGYHFQNIIGELLLFSLLLIGLKLLQRWRWQTFTLAVTLAVLLALSHQFSMFLAAFVLLPIIIALAYKYQRITLTILPVVGVFIIAGVLLGLHEKVPHIFTTAPHLLSQTPSPLRALELMQPAWLLLGLAGLIVLVRPAQKNLILGTFLISTLVFIILAQGPRVGIDIPPLRALLYSVVPLSVTAGYLLARFWQTSFTSAVFASVLVLALAGASVTNAFTLSHSLRTNSTLSVGQLALVELLKQKPGTGILVDDFNRRSASWLVLAGHPMFTRVANDLETQMNEASQSELRRKLYLNQLDFEKIFSLGSRPEVVTLMQKHNITWLTGIDGTSVSHFAHNPALTAVAKKDDITLFALREPRPTDSGDLAGGAGILNVKNSHRDSEPEFRGARASLDQWLLKPSTLANDIGDLEDTNEFLPLRIRSTRLSEPQVAGHTTYRTTNAPLVPIILNVGDFVRVLWSKDGLNQPDIALEFIMELVSPNAAGSRLSIITPTGEQYPWPGNGVALKLPASAVPFDEHGFLTLTLSNPTQQPLNIDLIAAGLAHTP